MTHPINAVFVDAVAPVKGDIRTHFQARVPLVLSSATEIQSLDVGATTAVYADGKLFHFDPLDTTTAHDGVTVLVDQTGRRFKIAELLATDGRYFVVIDKDLTAPPGSPSAGDDYIVGPSATGDWATHDGEIAVFAQGIWKFIAPRAGDIMLPLDEEKFYHRNAGNTAWVPGLPGTIGAGEITLANLLMGPTVKVLDIANNAAGGESNSAAYIVDTSPTGSFSGFTTNNLAILEGGTWIERTPAEGDVVWDLTASDERRWNGTSWAISSITIGVIQKKRFEKGSINIGTGDVTVFDFAEVQLTLSNASNQWLFTIFGTNPLGAGAVLNDNLGEILLRLRKDSSGTDLLTRNTVMPGVMGVMSDAPGDTTQHTYALLANGDSLTSNSNNMTFNLIAEEILP